MNNMKRYTVIPSRHWLHTSGAKASPFGACPWAQESERANWTLVTSGYTVKNNREGTIGIGRVPWATEAEAQTWADKENARL